MSDGFSKPLDGKALLIDAVVDRYGERCSDYQAGCACCAAWRAIDRIEELEAAVKLNQDLDAISLDHVAELEAKLAEARLSELAALGQADEAYTAQLELEAKLAAAVEALADMYRLHLRRGPAWDHEPTRAILDKTRATLAELTGGKDE